MKKRLMIFSFFLLLGIALFVALIIKTGIAETWQTLRQFSLFNFLIILALSLLNFCLYVLRWDIILKHIHGYDKKLTFSKLFLHRMSGFALSYIIPSAQTGGEPMRILLLQHEGVATRSATSSVIIDKALEFAALFVFIGAGILLAVIDGSLPGKTEFLLIAVLIVLAAVIFLFYFCSVKNIGFFSSILKFFHLDRSKRFQNLINKITDVEHQMSFFYKKHGSTFLLLILISLVISAFLLLEHYLIARFMGVNLTFFQTFLVSTIPYLAFLVPIPGGLGLLEGGTAAIFALLGVNINAFVLVLIIRIRDVVFVLIGLTHASKQGIKMLKKSFSKNSSS